MPRADFGWFALRSSHLLCRTLNGTVSCHICRQGAIGEQYDVFKWILSPCRGVPLPSIAVTPGVQSIPPGLGVWLGGKEIHPSHTLILFRGLYACTVCGATGSSKIRLLFEPCDGTMIASGPRDVQRIRTGVLPWGRTAWPDDRPAQPGMCVPVLEPSQSLMAPATTAVASDGGSDGGPAQVSRSSTPAPSDAQRRIADVWARVKARCSGGLMADQA